LEEAMPMSVMDYRPVDPPRNTLVAFLNLRLSPSGLVLHDCTEHKTAEGKRWIGLPGRPRIDSTAHLHRKDVTTGKFEWTPIVEIYGQAERERFQQAALAAIDRLRGAP
jgi:hypothetical protein